MKRVTKWIVSGMGLLGLTLFATMTASAIEKPEFEQLVKDGKMEVRKYAKIHIVSTSMEQEGQRNSAFRKLANYIGKGNEKQQKIKMTAPVIVDHSQKKDKADGAKVTMSFVVPKKVVEAGIPEPTDPDVKLSVIEGGKYAVTSFMNSNSEKARQEAITELRAWIKEKGYKEKGEPSFAFYNPPWIPQALRTNEVWIEID
ncbi:SOUL heme-binding protein [Rubritalea squalenifaciens DSM 18772]|uniref:SOUL heme-binding protein n=1 Tax=Rubritalea squalenifaciens DSM 18772 TaxID=1123071 RepID=A0A1M6LZ26_9BACT|nr:heme-binding protein [Rubritalea squalenifaciens]SHJ76313.1 SOUL heme-binding protein [Rubritalea squalenifaciens DSM 18772]